LKDDHLRQILEIELSQVQKRITQSAGTKFIFQCTDAAKEFLLREGIDYKYGARHLKRAIERFMVYPLSNLVATEQVEFGDLVIIDYSEGRDKLTFSKRSGGALIHEDFNGNHPPENLLVKSDGIGLPLPQEAKAASKGKGGDNVEN
jgi:ATP-dependent Clp protease ATP-binding subunit ClpB